MTRKLAGARATVAAVIPVLLVATPLVVDVPSGTHEMSVDVAKRF